MTNNYGKRFYALDVTKRKLKEDLLLRFGFRRPQNVAKYLKKVAIFGGLGTIALLGTGRQFIGSLFDELFNDLFVFRHVLPDWLSLRSFFFVCFHCFRFPLPPITHRTNQKRNRKKKHKRKRATIRMKREKKHFNKNLDNKKNMCFLDECTRQSPAIF